MKMVPKTCPECNVEFKPITAIQNYCSKKCGYEHRQKIYTEKWEAIMIGAKFGRWTVIARVPTERGKGFLWLCRCDCGTERVQPTGPLRANRTRSCGCLESELTVMRFSKFIEPGTKFGMLTVIERLGTRGNLWRYLCRCDCGKTSDVSSSSLRSGSIKSCGCIKLTAGGLSGTPEYHRWEQQIRRDEGESWTAPMTSALLKLQPACIICGSTNYLCIDHVLPISKGCSLTPGNAVVLCRSCNSKKSNRELDNLLPGWREKIEHAADSFLVYWENLSF